MRELSEAQAMHFMLDINVCLHATQIAAHALALDVTLVTQNIREFSRVPGLLLSDWVAVGAVDGPPA